MFTEPFLYPIMALCGGQCCRPFGFAHRGRTHLFEAKTKPGFFEKSQAYSAVQPTATVVLCVAANLFLGLLYR